MKMLGLDKAIKIDLPITADQMINGLEEGCEVIVIENWDDYNSIHRLDGYKKTEDGTLFEGVLHTSYPINVFTVPSIPVVLGKEFAEQKKKDEREREERISLILGKLKNEDKTQDTQRDSD